MLFPSVTFSSGVFSAIAHAFYIYPSPSEWR